MVTKQKLIFSLSLEGENLKVSFDFKPALVGEKNWDKLTNEEKHLQHKATRIASHLMDALKQDSISKE